MATTRTRVQSFLSVRRTADMINESLLRAHMWAVDRNITKTYIEDVLEGVNAYLRHLRTTGLPITRIHFTHNALKVDHHGCLRSVI
jgi:phage tail sheath protein FI